MDAFRAVSLLLLLLLASLFGAMAGKQAGGAARPAGEGTSGQPVASKPRGPVPVAFSRTAYAPPHSTRPWAAEPSATAASISYENGESDTAISLHRPIPTEPPAPASISFEDGEAPPDPVTR